VYTWFHILLMTESCILVWQETSACVDIKHKSKIQGYNSAIAEVIRVLSTNTVVSYKLDLMLLEQKSCGMTTIS
jgi:hypothetical protein